MAVHVRVFYRGAEVRCTECAVEHALCITASVECIFHAGRLSADGAECTNRGSAVSNWPMYISTTSIDGFCS